MFLILCIPQIIQNFSELNKISIGLLHIFIKHTSASLTINENDISEEDWQSESDSEQEIDYQPLKNVQKQNDFVNFKNPVLTEEAKAELDKIKKSILLDKQNNDDYEKHKFK